MCIRDSTGSAWVDGVTATGNFAVVTGNTFTGSNVHNDNVKSIYGTGSDGLEIFHNASDSIINDQGTGSLKLQTGGSTKLEVTSTGTSVTGNIVVSGNVDGRDVAADGTKLDGIATGATSFANVVEDTTPQLGGDLDMNGNSISSGTLNVKNTGSQSEVRLFCEVSNAHYVSIKAPAHSAYSGNITYTLPPTATNGQYIKTDANGNLSFAAPTENDFTTTLKNKLDNIEASATADQTAAEIRTLVESASDSNVFTDSDHTKLNAIEASATADQTASEIKTLLQSDKLTVNEIADDAVTAAKLASNAVVTASIVDDAVTNAKIDSVAASKLTGALPAIDGSALTGIASAEVYGFTGIADGTLQLTTTGGGSDNISGTAYAAFEDVFFAASGFSFSINTDGKLIATI